MKTHHRQNRKITEWRKTDRNKIKDYTYHPNHDVGEHTNPKYGEKESQNIPFFPPTRR